VQHSTCTPPAHPTSCCLHFVLKHTYNYSTNSPPFFVEPNVHYRLHNSPPLVSDPSQFNPSVLNMLFTFIFEFSSVGTATRYGLDRIPLRARFSAPVQTGPGAYPMDTGSPPWGYSSRAVMLNTHPHLAPRLKKKYNSTSTPLCTSVPYASLHCTFGTGLQRLNADDSR